MAMGGDQGCCTQYQQAVGEIGTDDIAPCDSRRSSHGRLEAGHQFWRGRAKSDDYQTDHQGRYAGAFSKPDRASHQHLTAQNQCDQSGYDQAKL
jgi:hypothetical protein